MTPLMEFALGCALVCLILTLLANGRKSKGGGDEGGGGDE